MCFESLFSFSYTDQSFDYGVQKGEPNHQITREQEDDLVQALSSVLSVILNKWLSLRFLVVYFCVIGLSYAHAVGFWLLHCLTALSIPEAKLSLRNGGRKAIFCQNFPT